MGADLTVALVTPWDAKGGIVDYSEQLTTHLESIDVDVRVVPIEDRSTPNPLAQAQLLDQLPDGTDVVHVQFEAGVFGRLGLSGIGAPAFFVRLGRDPRPAVTTLHEVHRRHPHRGPLGDAILRSRDTFIERLALGASAATVVHTKEAKDVLVDRHGGGYRIERMLHPVAPDATPIDARRAKEELSLAGPVALTFGWVEPKKKYADVIRALPDLPDLTYLIAGEPRQAEGREHLEETFDIAEEYGVDDRVRYLGYVADDDVNTVFSAADVVVLPYDRVGQSGVANVALAYHRPVITRSLPAFEELKDEFGCLLTYHTPDGVAGGLRRVLESAERQRQLEARAEDYTEQVSWERFAVRTKDLYDSVSGGVESR